MSMNGIDFCEVVSLVNDPEPRIGNSGMPWCTFRVAFNPREKDRKTGEWKDGEPTFLGAKAFGTFADKIAATFHKGDRALIKGKVVTERYKDGSGADRESLVLTVDEIGACPRFADVQVARAQQGGSGGGFSASAGVGSPGEGFGPENSDTSVFGGGSGDFGEPF